MRYVHPLVVYIASGIVLIAAGIYVWWLNGSVFGIAIMALGPLVILFGQQVLQFQTVMGKSQIDIAQQIRLQEDNNTLTQELETLRKLIGNRIPKVGILDDNDTPNPTISPLLNPDQLYVMQQLFADAYRIYITPLEGGYNNFGVYKVIRENPENNPLTPGVVVKYLNYRDVLKELDIHKEGNLLTKYPLDNTPGKPLNHWPSENRRGTDDKELGAVAYTLTLLDKKNQLQTLGSLYKQSSFDDFKFYLDSLFERLNNWHSQTLDRSREKIKPLGGMHGVYERLFRNRQEIEDGINRLLDEESKDIGPSIINFEDKELLDLPFLSKNWQNRKLGNPLWWITNVLKYGEASCFSNANVPYSPVHGDLHSGNILVETGQKNIWLIDFPNAEIGPTIQDIATLEADVKFSLINLDQCSFDSWLKFEEILMKPLVESGALSLRWPFLQGLEPEDEELGKAWAFVRYLRERVIEQHYIGADVRAYYLALLHETLPIVYRDKYTKQQKQCALISSAWMCHYLT